PPLPRAPGLGGRRPDPALAAGAFAGGSPRGAGARRRRVQRGAGAGGVDGRGRSDGTTGALIARRRAIDAPPKKAGRRSPALRAYTASERVRAVFGTPESRARRLPATVLARNPGRIAFCLHRQQGPCLYVGIVLRKAKSFSRIKIRQIAAARFKLHSALRM